ncbi:hypothetical protein H257_00758 [Aphanomyces astaci]|uniref:Enkurin domain-containing protein n=1 Tax=Aphanomyces astaci TaxID=112090 RepID=W4HDU3_APHAT|nr:hypothetical protein H257_00758 [Aphanomyces astaci]ETV89494.1 hypothetical protein H257_00758 [Aphanomyces astaci]|eukprot:XP_009821894.1 hypothetical protein H257_00758 [Aphanomyces astaci]
MNNEAEAHGSGDAAEAWRAFGSDTEAGRLLKKLYCGNSKPVINYPKVKTKKQQTPAGPFIPGGGGIGADTRSNNLAASNTARSIKVPTLGNQSTHQYHAIDVIPAHRRHKDVIDKELGQIKRSIEGFRPSVASYPGSQAEKQKLQQRFTYAPGTILPQEMLPGSGKCIHLSRYDNPVHRLARQGADAFGCQARRKANDVARAQEIAVSSSRRHRLAQKVHCRYVCVGKERRDRSDASRPAAIAA